MKTSWFRGLNETETKEVRGNFLESLVMRKRLKIILEEKQQESLRQHRNKAGYDSPNWAYLQADSVGYERAINEIIQLIS